MAPGESASRANLVRPYRLAILACGLSFVLVLCSGLLAFLNDMLDPDSSFAIIGLTSAVVGGVVASKRPANPVGWLFVGAALGIALHEFARQWAAYGLATEPGALPFGRAMAWIAIWSGPLGTALMFVILPLYFPDGRPVSPRWRPVIRTAIFILAVNLLLHSLMPDIVVDGTDIANPLGIEALRPVLSLLSGAGLALWLGLIFVAIVSLVARFRRSRGEKRQQLKWFMYAVSTVLVWFCVNWPIEAAIPDLFPFLDALVISGIPIAVGIAILKYRLYDIDILINRTLVYGALTAIVVSIYVLVVGYLGTLFRTEDNLAGSLIAAGVVAVLFAPLRERLQRIVNRLMYGERDDPYKVLSDLGERLETTLTPSAVLPSITESVASALKLPYVAITLKQNGEGFVEAARYGKKKETAGELFSVPLTYQKEKVGELLLASRSPGEGFSKPDLRLLENLARQAGVAAHAVRLTTDLQRSRERLVTTREEERRRLRRDLHDGVGPQLAALMLELETASEIVSDDPEVSALMSKLSERTREAVSDVRRSVRALRPPSLDEFGLVAALRETAAQYARGGLGVSVEAPEELPPLPAAVEVACYRIAQEAMTNVVRHAQASNCRVRLALKEEASALMVEVEDDGRGIRENHRAGVGMSSMRERAEELGGRCSVGPSPQGGTLVSALLPCWRITGGTDHSEE